MNTQTTLRRLIPVLGAFLVVALVPILPPIHAQEQNSVLVLYENNPVLTVGAEGEWDSATVIIGDIVAHEGMYTMFYSGGTDRLLGPLSIGIATSEDGLHWTKSEHNPILTPDAVTSDSYSSIIAGSATVYEGVWHHFITRANSPGSVRNSTIWQATATSPEGPWTVTEDPVLELGGTRRWDSLGQYSPSVIITDGGLCLFYGGLGGQTGIGLAQSSDGETWIKYNNPDTTQTLYSESDIVVTKGDYAGWSGGFISLPNVVRLENEWLMFYVGLDGQIANAGLGYATSPDCIAWTSGPYSPLWSQPWNNQFISSRTAAIVVDSEIWIYGLFGQEERTHSINLAILALSDIELE